MKKTQLNPKFELNQQNTKLSFTVTWREYQYNWIYLWNIPDHSQNINA